MVSNFFCKKKQNLYIGKLAVAPRKDLKRHVDQLGSLPTEDLESGLRQSLLNLFLLPTIEERNTTNKKDIALDVIISKFQSGDFWYVDVGVVEFPLFWRPKIHIVSRLYCIYDGKTKFSISITEKMKWREYLARLLSWRSLFRYRPLFDSKDMEPLLYRGCLNILKKTEKRI